MSMSMSIDLATVIQQAPHVLATDMAGDTVMMDALRGKYYGLNSVGTVIWNRLEQPMTVQHLLAELGARYEGDPAVIQREVIALLESLLEGGLLAVIA